MAKVNFDSLDSIQSARPQNNASSNDVAFFSLRDDGDEKVVRFMIDSVDDYDLQTVHEVQLGSKRRKVGCLRDPHDSFDACPLCATGSNVSDRFFIRLIQYETVKDAQGNQKIVPQAAIWERSTAYARTLKSYLDNYGPLSDIICKVIRHGKAGDMQTTYEIVPNLNKMIYKDEIYVKDPTLFGDFQTLGTIVMDKTFAELQAFVATGEFPAVEKATPAQPAPVAPPAQSYSAPTTPAQPAYTAPPAQAYDAPAPQAQPFSGPTQFGGAAAFGGITPRQTPWGNPTDTGAIEKPRRY